MIVAVVCTLIGLALSAFFSGSETGFYRVARIRLLMDAKGGNPIAMIMLWLVLRPSLVVATVLIGNNIANYLVSFGMLLLTQRLFANLPENIQASIPVVVTPALFVYGELLPKYLYFHAPYRLSRRGAPLMVFFAILFLPLSLLVIALETLWQWLAMRENVPDKLGLERRQLQRVLLESREAGILRPIQQTLAQNVFVFGNRPVRRFAMPMRALPKVPPTATREEILQQADRFRQNVLAVQSPAGELQGSFILSDAVVLSAGKTPRLRPILQISGATATLEVLVRMQQQDAPLAVIQDAQGKPIGFVTRDRLTALLLPPG